MNNNTTHDSLPSRPNLEQLRKQAKDLKRSEGHDSLSNAQRALAQRYGFPSWPKLKQAAALRLLRHLIQDGEVAPVRELLDQEPRLINLRFEEGESPLHCAAEENRPALVELLVERGADLNARFSGSAHTALSWALTCWSTEAAQKLVELGDAPDLFCSAGLGLTDRLPDYWNGDKLISGASQTGSSRYDENGVALPRPPESDRDQISDALYIACRNGHLETSRFLLARGADPNFRAYAGASCLAWAYFSENNALIDLLIEKGGSEDVLDHQFGVRPSEFKIMVWAGWGFGFKLVHALNANPSLAKKQTANGTALHAAASGGQAKVIEILLKAGADPNARNKQGATPAEVAASKGFDAVAELLSSRESQ